MGAKRGPRNSGPKNFIKTWLITTNPETLIEAYRKEASREVTEMMNWKKETEKYDPQAYVYEDDVFPMIDQSNKYRMRIYDQGKKIKDALATMNIILKDKYGNVPDATFYADPEVMIARKVWADAEDEQIRLCWRIKKIHVQVKLSVRADLGANDTDPFAEYEYDPS